MRVSSPGLVPSLVALATILCLDAVWLTFSTRIGLYPSLEGVRLHYGLLAWSATAVAIACLQDDLAHEPLVWGVGVGAVLYTFFNGTELAIRPSWTLRVALVDIVWGVVLCGVTSVVTHGLV